VRKETSTVASLTGEGEGRQCKDNGKPYISTVKDSHIARSKGKKGSGGGASACLKGRVKDRRINTKGICCWGKSPWTNISRRLKRSKGRRTVKKLGRQWLKMRLKVAP